MKENTSERPLVTFALFAYNQEAYIQEAVKGALAQDYDNLEIIFSDDCSSDRTFELMEYEISSYCGGHDIVLNRNKENLGVAAHINKVFKLARGEVIVVAAGDDVSYDYRVTDVVKSFSLNLGAKFVSFVDDRIDSGGFLTKANPVKRQSLNSSFNVSIDYYLSGSKVSLSGASRAYKRDVFSFFGDLNSYCPTEDTPLLLRSLLLGEGIVLPYAGIKYRRHGGNLSVSSSLAGMNFGAISEQYEKDLLFAKKKGLVSKGEFDAISNWISENMNRRILHKDFESARGIKKIYALLHLIFRSSYSKKTKLVFFLRYINFIFR
ncbi:glycosyltransferase family 2 protein [Marinobacter shengliensis]|uniref:glycosyltransferase family 2 protein n=1 Tax=Marinobacter shengliensis TaxID=1389223 RepID=UPI0011088FB5|nr:glycosyltransferase family 2 protein [Marinobacter shengliensis]